MSEIKIDQIEEIIPEKPVEKIFFKELEDYSLTNIDDLQLLFPNWNRENTLKKIKKTIEGKDHRFIAIKNGEIISHIKVLKKKSIHKHIVELTSLITRKDERRKGIAKKLLEFTLKKMPKEIKLVILSVDSKNKNAILLYKKMGFRKYGLLKKGSIINGKFVNNILMVKELKK